MKTLFLLAAIISLFSISGCNYMSDFSPGSLGSVADTEFHCSSTDVQQRVDVLLEINPYEIKAKDTLTVNEWKNDGYDFLNYRCINIRKRLYVITINSDGPVESSISIRAYYDRNKKDWVVAKKFTHSDNYRAEKAMEYLSNQMSTCL